MIHEPSFLARRTLGLPNYFLIALIMAFLLALVPRGARKAIESNTNNVKDWLPRSYPESADLRWFQKHFVGEQFAVVSYDGCTLGDHERLTLLARKLVPSDPQPEAAEADDRRQDGPFTPIPPPVSPASATPDGEGNVRRWFSRVITGPEVLEELTQAAQGLSRTEALERLEGALFGPRPTDPQGNPLPQEARTTCLIVTLSKQAVANNKNMRAAIEAIRDVAINQCAISADELRMGGPPVDNVTIDIEGEKTLFRLALLSGIVGLTLSYWCFRSVRLTAMVFAVGVTSAAMSLAIVFYYGVYEKIVYDQVRLGTVDAILMSMPSVVYVLGLSGAIHIVNYYKDARREGYTSGAPEIALRHAMGPCSLAAFTTAVGLASLYTSDITPIKKFGTFTAVSVLATLGVLFTVLPIALYRFPPRQREIHVDEKRAAKRGAAFSIPALINRVGGLVVRHNLVVCSFWILAMVVVGIGLTRIQTSVQLLKLFDEDARIIKDYAWLENNLGNLVPMEVVVAIDKEQTRFGNAVESPEANGKRYRMSYIERVQMIRRIAERIEALPQVGKVMALSTFVPEIETGSFTDAGKRSILEEQLRQEVESSHEYVADEQLTADQLDDPPPDGDTGRELWRASARVRALDDGEGGDIDYGRFVKTLRDTVEPVMWAYRQRDRVLAELHKQGKTLADAKLLLLFRAPPEQGHRPPEDSQAYLLAELLTESFDPQKLRAREALVGPLNLAATNQLLQDEEKLKAFQAEADIEQYDAAIVMWEPDMDAAQQLTAGKVPLIDVSQDAAPPGTPAKWNVASTEPLPAGAVYTGIVPLVYKTQRQLLFSLRESIGWATGLIAVVMILVLRSPAAGLVSMVPNVFPIVMVFGTLGWLGIKIDIGIMMTASVALGVAVDDTIHFVWWYQHGTSEGMDRKSAVMYAYDRCGTAMTQTTIIAGLGLAVFGASTFTPTQQFGFLMLTMLATALVGDLLLLPAILAGPIGKLFDARSGRKQSVERNRSDAQCEPRIYAPHSQRQDAPHRSAKAS